MQTKAAVALPRDIDADLDAWLEPFLDATGRKTRRKMAPLYVRGLLGDGGRKSIQPMAERLGLPGHDQLHHFISSPAWDDAPLWRVLAEQADRQVGGADAVLVVDDTGLPKKGDLSVGVAPQYCGAVGKTANCQVLVSPRLIHTGPRRYRFMMRQAANGRSVVVRSAVLKGAASVERGRGPPRRRRRRSWCMLPACGLVRQECWRGWARQVSWTEAGFRIPPRRNARSGARGRSRSPRPFGR